MTNFKFIQSNENPILISNIKFDRIEKYGINLNMARVDQNNTLASGNKIYKLKPIIEYAKANNFKQILSFGGAFSNHIHALALLTNKEQIESIALIRGEPEYANNPTLTDAQNAGMYLEFVNRTDYKQRNNQQYITQLQKRYPNALIIAEGGSSQLAIQGCAQMARDINYALQQPSDILAVASGTGATAAGLICGLAKDQHLNVYSVLKDPSLPSRIEGFIKNEKREFESESDFDKYSNHTADFGGYAKLDKTLLDFILHFLEQTDILLDPIYTSKMCLRVIQQIEAGQFAKGQSITLIHSGGLQGWRGMQHKVESLSGSKTTGVHAWDQIDEYLNRV